MNELFCTCETFLFWHSNVVGPLIGNCKLKVTLCDEQLLGDLCQGLRNCKRVRTEIYVFKGFVTVDGSEIRRSPPVIYETL